MYCNVSASKHQGIVCAVVHAVWLLLGVNIRMDAVFSIRAFCHPIMSCLSQTQPCLLKYGSKSNIESGFFTVNPKLNPGCWAESHVQPIPTSQQLVPHELRI